MNDLISFFADAPKWMLCFVPALCLATAIGHATGLDKGEVPNWVHIMTTTAPAPHPHQFQGDMKMALKRHNNLSGAI